MVSVVIPTYNSGKLLKEALFSVLHQTLSDVEIIVVDDGSTDDTKRIVNDYINNNKGRIRYFYQKNSGPSAARNKGIKEARGEYLSFLDSDDIWSQAYLEKMLEKIEQGYDWVVCDNFREVIDIDTGKVERNLVIREISEAWGHEEVLKAFLTLDRIGSPNKILVRRNVVLEKEIAFDTALRSREDWDFCVQLAKNRCSLGMVHEPLVSYRIRNDNSNSTRKMGLRWLGYTLVFLKKYRSLYQALGMRRALADHYYALAREYWNEKKDVGKTAWCLGWNVYFGGIESVLGTCRCKMRKRQGVL